MSDQDARTTASSPWSTCATACRPVIDPGALAEVVRGLRRRHRTGGHRRRARLGLPLRPARLPRAAAPGGGRHGAHRPGRLPGPRRPQRLDERSPSAEWVLHAAYQDLACLAELGLAPRTLFDTELAGRLAGFERVGLAAIVERMLGLSPRPRATARRTGPAVRCPRRGCGYAALDVEVLVELRDALEAELVDAGQARLGARGVRRPGRRRPPRPGSSPGGAPPGCTRSAAAVSSPASARCGRRATRWPARRDLAPGRILPTPRSWRPRSVAPATEADLLAIGRSAAAPPGGTSPPGSAALRAGAGPCRRAGCPSRPPRRTGRHRPHRWADRDPVAAARLSRVRARRSPSTRVRPRTSSTPRTPDRVDSSRWSRRGGVRSDPSTVTDSPARRLSARRRRGLERLVAPRAAADPSTSPAGA